MNDLVITPLYAMLNVAAQNLAAGLALAISGWAMWAFHRYLTPWLGQQNEAMAAKALNIALANGVAAGMQKLEAFEKLHSNVEVKNAVTAWAANYAMARAPDAVDRFGLSPDDLATKALAFLPVPPASSIGTAAPKPAPVEVKPLPAAK